MGKWILLQPPDSLPRPAPRGGHASISIGRRVVCFGGADRAPTPFSDIWVLHSGTDLSGAFGDGGQYEWTKMAPVSAKGDKLLPRVGCTMCSLGDIIYIYGGQDPLTAQCFDTIIALDMNLWNWAEVKVPGVKPPSRHSHCAVVLNGRSLVVFGGAGAAGILGDLWIFDIFTRIWTHPKTSGAPASPREMHSGTMVSDTQMLVFGGRSATGQVLADLLLFDIEELTWRSTEVTPFPRCSHSAVLVPTWAAGLGEPARPSSRGGDGPAAAAANGNDQQAGPSVVLAFGGYSGSAVEGNLLCLDPATLKVTELHEYDAQSPTSPQPRFAHTMAAVYNNHSNMDVVVIAGVNPAKDLNEVAVWRPTSNQPPPSPSLKA